MSQFDICRNNSDSKRTFPYLLLVQSDLLEPMPTCLVVPMMAAESVSAPIERLHLAFDVNGQSFVALFSELAGIHRSGIGMAVASADELRDDIIAAIDFMILGF